MTADISITAHVKLYMHPQAIIIDGSNTEDAYLQSGMRTFAESSQTSLLELPTRGAHRLAWLTKLDSASLSSMFPLQIVCLCSFLFIDAQLKYTRLEQDQHRHSYPCARWRFGQLDSPPQVDTKR